LSAEISVVIPAYNAEKYLEETIRSVQCQTFRNFEIIVVDDGSTDRTAEIAEAGGARCIRQQNCGVSHARNRGVEEASGRYVAFLDADDLWAPAKLERQLAELARLPLAGACFTGMLRVNSTADAVIDSVEARPSEDFCQDLLLHSCVVILSSSALVKRELLRQEPFDPQFSQCADWDLLIRLSRRTMFAIVGDPLIRYRTTPTSMSRSIALLERDTLGVLRKFFAADPPLKYAALERHAYGNHWMILAGSYLHAFDLRNSLRCVFSGIHAYPRAIVRPIGLPVRWLKRAFLRASKGPAHAW